MTAPEWYQRAHDEMGVAETPGQDATPRVMEYFGAAPGSTWVKDDGTPWCGAFASWIFKDYGLPDEPLRARSWASWGAGLEDPVPGCVVVLKRPPDPNAGHVALFVGWTKDKAGVLLLGGNQGDRVCIARYRAADVIAYRWPPKEPITKATELANGSRIKAEAKQLAEAGAATVSVGTASAALPAIPAPPTETLNQLTAWQAFGGQALDFLSFVKSHWMLAAGVLMCLGAVRIYRWRLEDAKEGKTWQF